MNKRSRKYQLTINNPIEKGYSRDLIKDILLKTNPIYMCLCDEIGDNGTPHTHIYIVYKNAVYFDTMKKRMPEAHIESTNGSSQENRDYIRKEGKHLYSDKKDTNIIETFEEFGEIPLDKSSQNQKVSEQVLDMIINGFTNAEIITKIPSYTTKINSLEIARQTFIEEENIDKWRDIECTYIYGTTATGKTRYVMDKFGYRNVYKITNYEHPFDGYKSEDVILFDEFRSSLLISDMLQYMDGYPCRLPARYADKIACFTKIFIISNIPLSEQYVNIQHEQPNTWDAFRRRIHKKLCFSKINETLPYYDKSNIDITELFE